MPGRSVTFEMPESEAVRLSLRSDTAAFDVGRGMVSVLLGHDPVPEDAEAMEAHGVRFAVPSPARDAAVASATDDFLDAVRAEIGTLLDGLADRPKAGAKASAREAARTILEGIGSLRAARAAATPSAIVGSAPGA